MKEIIESLKTGKRTIKFDNDHYFVPLKEVEAELYKYEKTCKKARLLITIIGILMVIYSTIWCFIEFNKNDKLQQTVSEYQRAFQTQNNGKTYYIMQKNEMDSLVTLSFNSCLFWSRHYGLPDTLTLKVIAKETGWLESELANHENNLFGMKKPGRRITTAINLKRSDFAYYNSFMQSIKDFHIYNYLYGAERMMERGIYCKDNKDYLKVLKSIDLPKTTIKFDTLKTFNNIYINIK